MIFKDFFPSQMQNRIKQYSKYGSIPNNTLKLMDAISQSMNKTIQEIYTYMSVRESLARMTNDGQQEKQGLVEYMEKFKQEKSIIKSSIGENIWDSFVKTTKEFKKLDEVEDSDEIISMKKNAFEAWSTMVFMRVSDGVQPEMSPFSTHHLIRVN